MGRNQKRKKKSKGIGKLNSDRGKAILQVVKFCNHYEIWQVAKISHPCSFSSILYFSFLLFFELQL